MTDMDLRTIKSTLAAAALLVAAGCASVDVSTIPYPDVPVFAPTDPARVQLLRAEPARPVVKLGEITVDVTSRPPPTAQEVDGLLRTAAAKLGADAAVLVVDALRPGEVAPLQWWGRTATGQGKVIAVAVRYR
jgi:hypothetical protein